VGDVKRELRELILNALPASTADEAADSADESDFRPLTAEEAQSLRERDPSISLWAVVGGQVLVGFLVALVAWLLTARPEVAASAAYGALAVVIPAAMFARGLTGRLATASPSAAVLGFVLWELVKIGLTLAMLMVAPRLISGLSWLAMLAGLVVTIKVYWVALAFRKRSLARPQSSGKS